MTVTVALAGANLLVTVPSPVEGRSHVLEIPLTVGGLKALRKLLQNREHAADRRLATPASPTQQMVQEWLAEERRISATKPLFEGLDLSSIDLDL